MSKFGTEIYIHLLTLRWIQTFRSFRYKMRSCKLQLIVALANNKNGPSRETTRVCTTAQSIYQFYTRYRVICFCLALWELCPMICIKPDIWSFLPGTTSCTVSFGQLEVLVQLSKTLRCNRSAQCSRCITPHAKKGLCSSLKAFTSLRRPAKALWVYIVPSLSLIHI